MLSLLSSCDRRRQSLLVSFSSAFMVAEVGKDDKNIDAILEIFRSYYLSRSGAFDEK